MSSRAPAGGEPQRTNPRGLVVMALEAVLRGGLPALVGLIGSGAIGMGLLVVLPVLPPS
jgi:hypothetical protein